MAGARAIRGGGWSLSLLGLTCCAAEADVLSAGALSGGPVAEVDAGARPQSVDGSADDGGAADAAWSDAFVVRDGGNGPTWTRCDPQEILARGLTGDACSFAGSCSSLEPTCGQRTALCADGILYLGQVSKNVCTEDDPQIRGRCARAVPDSCCIELWQCESSPELLANQPVVRVCALECENEGPAAPGDPFTSCPGDPDGLPFPPALGTPCAGSFVCDSSGRSVGLGNEPFTLDDYGRIYWCQRGVVQHVAIGSSLPWNTQVFQ